MKLAENKREDTSASLIERTPWSCSLWMKLVFSVVVALLCLTGVEISLRKTGVKLPPQSIQCGLPQYQAQPEYGYSLRPGISTTYQYPRSNPRTLRLVSNSDGFRSSRELGEPDPRTRILVIGDSFVFGQGVEEKERFTDLLEAKRPDWRVDNLGMTGYGADLMLLAFQALGRKSKAGAMILCIYTDDFRRVRPHYAGVGFKIPRFQLAGDRLQRAPYPPRRFWDRFYTAAALRIAWWKVTDSERRLNAAILEETLKQAGQYRMAVGIAFLPGTGDTPDDQARRHWLAQFAREHATPFIDLTDAIHAHGADAFLSENWHLGPLGHNIVADELVRFISGEVLAKDRRRPVGVTAAP